MTGGNPFYDLLWCHNEDTLPVIHGAPGGGRWYVLITYKQLQRVLRPGYFAIWQMRLCWYSKCAMNVFSPSLCSSQLGTFESSKPKYLSGDKVFVYCLRVPCLSVWESCLSPVTPSHITCIFLPSPVSWLYWQLSWNVQGHRVSLWATKKVVYTLFMPWYSNQLGPCPRLSDNWKENIHLIWQQQKTVAGRLNRFETDPYKSWWRNVAVLDWFTAFWFNSSSELNIGQY